MFIYFKYDILCGAPYGQNLALSNIFLFCLKHRPFGFKRSQLITLAGVFLTKFLIKEPMNQQKASVTHPILRNHLSWKDKRKKKSWKYHVNRVKTPIERTLAGRLWRHIIDNRKLSNKQADKPRRIYKKGDNLKKEKERKKKKNGRRCKRAPEQFAAIHMKCRSHPHR